MEQINIRAVEMVRNIRDSHYEQLKDKSGAPPCPFISRCFLQSVHQSNHKSCLLIPI
jgi:predicted N-acyltransferase